VARGDNIPRRAMADACLVVENMAANVYGVVLLVREWRVESGGAATRSIVGGAFR